MHALQLAATPGARDPGLEVSAEMKRRVASLAGAITFAHRDFTHLPQIATVGHRITMRPRAR
jgi:hypothetical protein